MIDLNVIVVTILSGFVIAFILNKTQRNKVMIEMYTVWVGGVEAVCYPVDMETARHIAEKYWEEGYDDVHICIARNVYD